MLQTTHRKSLILISVAVLSLGAMLAAAPSSSNSPDTVLEQLAVAKAQRSARMLQSWKNSDTPFIDIRKQVDEAVAAGTSAQTLAKTYKNLAQAKPGDAKSQFRWAYAAFRASDAVSISQNRPRLEGVPDALWKVSNPRSYEYDRLMFLTTNAVSRQSATQPLGERLLRRNPEDEEVIYTMIPLLTLSGGADLQRAKDYSRVLVEGQPKSLKYNLILGYALSANASNTKADIQQAVSVYQRSLQLSPPAELRGRIEAVIRVLRKKQNV